MKEHVQDSTLIYENRYALIEDVRGPNNNGDLTQGYKRTFIKTIVIVPDFNPDKAYFRLDISTESYGMYTSQGRNIEPRELVFKFKDGASFTIRADNSRYLSRSKMFEYNYEIGHYEINNLRHRKLSSIILVDYKQDLSRTIYPTYDQFIADQIECLFK